METAQERIRLGVSQCYYWWQYLNILGEVQEDSPVALSQSSMAAVTSRQL